MTQGNLKTKQQDGISFMPQGQFIIVHHLEDAEVKTKGGIFLARAANNVWTYAEVVAVGIGVDRTKCCADPGDIVLVNSDDGIDLHGDKLLRDHMIYAIVYGVQASTTNKEK